MPSWLARSLSGRGAGNAEGRSGAVGRAALPFLLLAACYADAPPLEAPPEVVDRPPSIVDVTVGCNSVDAEWSFDAESDAWTGNGEVLLSSDGRYLERHRFPSVESARDGSSDRLEVSLDIVGDWRDVTVGVSTVFNCEEPGLAGLLYLYETDGETLGDCRWFGEDRWAGWASEEGCETPLAAEDFVEEG